MRSCFCLFLGLLAVAPAQGQPKIDPNAPIKIITLDRKDSVSYEKDIEPIFLNKCSVCHSGNVTEARLDISSYEALMKGGKRGKPIVPGKADQSLLYQLSAKTRRPLMPPKSEKPLAPEELALIKLWIDQGAKAPTGARVRAVVALGTPPESVVPVRAVDISPDKKWVVASRGNQLHVYDATKGDFVRTLVQPGLVTFDKKPVQAAHLSLVESLGYSPDGKLLASGSFQELLLWDAATGQVKQRIDGFSDRIVALGFSRDGKYLATAGGPPSEDGEVRVFEVATGKLVLDLKNGHSDTVFGLSFSPDGKMLATASGDKFVKVWEIPGGKLVKTFEGHTHHVMDVGWKSDGKLLASAGADNVVKVWDFEKGEQARTINAHNKQVTRLLFIGAKPEFVTCSGDAQVRFWNVDNGGNFRNFGGANDFVYAVSVSADGALLAAGGEEGVVRLYNGQNGQMIKELKPVPPAPPKK